MWYRIELNKDRSVRSCVEVSGSISEGRSIHYIEADSKASAIAILAAKYDRRAAKLRKSNESRYRRLSEAGLCHDCAERSVEAGMSRCEVCRARRRVSGDYVRGNRPRVVTAEAKAVAEAKRRAQRNRRQSETRGNRHRSDRAKRGALLEALEAFETMTPSRFRGWLVAKIAECQDKIDGKKSIAEHFPQAAE